jgi:sporulation protein YlmC with PRC-barrel domain
MRKAIASVTVFAAVALLLTAGALAQMSTPSPESRPSVQMGKEWLGSKLIGADIKNQQGENLGEIKDLIIDPQNGQIKQVVISAGGVMGLGAKRVAIPWNQMKPAGNGHGFVVAMSQEELRNAPEWEEPAGSGRTTSPAPRR